MSVTSRAAYRESYRSKALNSLTIGKTVRPRQVRRRMHRHRVFVQNGRAARPMRTASSIDRKKIKEIGLRMGRYSGRYTGGTPGRRP